MARDLFKFLVMKLQQYPVFNTLSSVDLSRSGCQQEQDRENINCLAAFSVEWSQSADFAMYICTLCCTSDFTIYILHSLNEAGFEICT